MYHKVVGAAKISLVREKDKKSAENLHFKEGNQEQRYKGDKGASYTDIWKKSTAGNEN